MGVMWAGELGQSLRALAALAVDPDSVSITYLLAHKVRHGSFTSVGIRHRQCTHTCGQNIHTHKKYFKNWRDNNIYMLKLTCYPKQRNMYSARVFM